MKNFKNICAALSVVFIASCGTSQVAVKGTTKQPVVSSSRESRLADAIHNEVNRHRVSKGLKKLEIHRGLTKLAQSHSNYMRDNAGKFSVESDTGLITHYGFEAREVYVKRKYRIMSLSENVLASWRLGQGVDLAPKMLKSWLDSPNHRHNIESKWALTGMAVSFDNNGKVFVTQLFGAAPSQAHRLATPTGEW